MATEIPDTWTEPTVDFCDVTITQGSFDANIDSYTDVSCTADIETVFDPRIRLIVSGRNDETGARTKVDVRLSDREELLEMAHQIVAHYGAEAESESNAATAPSDGSGEAERAPPACEVRADVNATGDGS